MLQSTRVPLVPQDAGTHVETTKDAGSGGAPLVESAAAKYGEESMPGEAARAFRVVRWYSIVGGCWDWDILS